MMQQDATVSDTVACHSCQREVPRSEAERSAARAGFAAVEKGRIEFLVRRDGLAAATQWVRRTLGIYRRAVLDPRHHASAQEYRAKFIRSYCSFKSWLYRTTPGTRTRAS